MPEIKKEKREIEKECISLSDRERETETA